MNSVDAATAELEFERFVECMDLDVNEKTMTDEDRVDFQSLKDLFVKNVKSGKITVNDDGEPTVHFQKTENLSVERVTFFEPDGAAFLALDKGKKNADNAKQFMMMGEITKQDPSLFSKMKNRDLKVCKVIMTLFLA
jgi:hypothetical protein